MPTSLVVSVFVALLALGGGAYYLTTKTEVTVQLPPQPAVVAPQPDVVVAPQVTVQVVPQAASPTKKVIPSNCMKYFVCKLVNLSSNRFKSALRCLSPSRVKPENADLYSPTVHLLSEVLHSA